jgi:hypothetical protein
VETLKAQIELTDKGSMNNHFFTQAGALHLVLLKLDLKEHRNLFAAKKILENIRI